MITPTINVNLRPCRCQEPKKRAAPCEPGHHRPKCGPPVPLPCPLPRTVDFQVRLGECDSALCGMARAHHAGCPAEPVRVTCLVGGDTWEASEVVDDDIEIVAGQDAVHWLDSAEKERAVAACRERWALVKAIMLGHQDISSLLTGPTAAALLTQRDAVFSALAKMARTEDAHQKATSTLFEALKAADPEQEHVTDAGGAYGMSIIEGRPNAEAGLDSYLTILLEKLEVMT